MAAVLPASLACLAQVGTEAVYVVRVGAAWAPEAPAIDRAMTVAAVAATPTTLLVEFRGVVRRVMRDPSLLGCRRPPLVRGTDLRIGNLMTFVGTG
ncbi:hypothetical protein GCM10025780_28850 [Frondihabitans cladoniiphilus]|uniref:Secreted protein n=1 Tax=Frondihabitans cladoniiphilus TaxID=715785 RepID=A0ABP8W541_9MICO